MEKIQLNTEKTDDYIVRNQNREATLNNATMGLVAHFMGKPINDDLKTANNKVDQLADELLNDAGNIDGYIRGSLIRKQKLIDAINASTLTHMDADAKAVIVNLL